MRLSCNGCRVLRKGCGDDCPIRPCLRWIKSCQSQANATVFLAKFYGRAGLINLLNAGPDHLRPAIFKSLLYEACGRIVNPVCGATGLLWSGSWQLCQEAVEAVLGGVPITRVSDESALSCLDPPLQAYDIRHASNPNKGSSDCLRNVRSRSRFKRSAAKTSRSGLSNHDSDRSPDPVRWSESDSASVGSVDGAPPAEDGAELELELTLGFERTDKRASAERRERTDDTFQLRVGFDAWV